MQIINKKGENIDIKIFTEIKSKKPLLFLTGIKREWNRKSWNNIEDSQTWKYFKNCIKKRKRKHW